MVTTTKKTASYYAPTFLKVTYTGLGELQREARPVLLVPVLTLAVSENTISTAVLPGGRSPHARPRAAAAGLGKGRTGPAAAHESQRQARMSC